jgi:hypothetical protein
MDKVYVKSSAVATGSSILFFLQLIVFLNDLACFFPKLLEAFDLLYDQRIGMSVSLHSHVQHFFKAFPIERAEPQTVHKI